MKSTSKEEPLKTKRVINEQIELVKRIINNKDLPLNIKKINLSFHEYQYKIFHILSLDEDITLELRDLNDLINYKRAINELKEQLKSP